MAGNFDGIKTRNFGIEIEMTGLTRCQAAKRFQVFWEERLSMRVALMINIRLKILKAGIGLLCTTEVSTVTMQTATELPNPTVWK